MCHSSWDEYAPDGYEEERKKEAAEAKLREIYTSISEHFDGVLEKERDDHNQKVGEYLNYFLYRGLISQIIKHIEEDSLNSVRSMLPILQKAIREADADNGSAFDYKSTLYDMTLERDFLLNKLDTLEKKVIGEEA